MQCLELAKTSQFAVDFGFCFRLGMSKLVAVVWQVMLRTSEMHSDEKSCYTHLLILFNFLR